MTANLVLVLFALLPPLFAVALVCFFQGRPAGTARRSWGALLAGNALVLALLVSLTLLGGELYYRFVYDTTDAFGLARVTRDWMLEHEHMNQFGFRDSLDYDLELAPGQRRVSVVGDSFSAGHGVPDVENRFANLVRHAHPEWDVQALATNGFDTGQELRLLQDLSGARYSFDLVVLAYCLNDIADIVPEWQAIQAELYGRGPPPFFIDHSYLLNTLYHRLVSARNPRVAGYYDFVLDAYRGPLWEVQQARLKDMAELVRAEGGELVVVVFPFLQHLGPGYEYAQIHAQLERCFDRLGVRHLDLLETYAGQAPSTLVVNPRDPHPNERAHELAAQAIVPFVSEALEAHGR